MYDQWVQEVDNSKMVGVMMIDLSAAFDMVDYSLLVEKLALFVLMKLQFNGVKTTYQEDHKAYS